MQTRKKGKTTSEISNHSWFSQSVNRHPSTRQPSTQTIINTWQPPTTDNHKVAPDNHQSIINRFFFHRTIINTGQSNLTTPPNFWQKNLDKIYLALKSVGTKDSNTDLSDLSAWSITIKGKVGQMRAITDLGGEKWGYVNSPQQAFLNLLLQKRGDQLIQPFPHLYSCQF